MSTIQKGTRVATRLGLGTVLSTRNGGPFYETVVAVSVRLDRVPASDVNYSGTTFNAWDVLPVPQSRVRPAPLAT